MTFYKTHPPTRTLFFFFFNDTATTEIYTLSLHDALPIWRRIFGQYRESVMSAVAAVAEKPSAPADRKSTRLNSSHLVISYAVFCLKKKKHTHLRRYFVHHRQPRTTPPCIHTEHHPHSRVR